jgi:hypothetical protein
MTFQPQSSTSTIDSSVLNFLCYTIRSIAPESTRRLYQDQKSAHKVNQDSLYQFHQVPRSIAFQLDGIVIPDHFRG